MLDRQVKLSTVVIGALFILVIYSFGLFLFSLTWKLVDPQMLLNQISLAASAASIALALVAIIFAFFQTREASAQNTLFHESLKELNIKMSELRPEILLHLENILEKIRMVAERAQEVELQIKDETSPEQSELKAKINDLVKISSALNLPYQINNKTLDSNGKK